MGENVFIPNHKHILIQGFIKFAPKKESEINLWLEQLVEKVGMKVVAGPVSKYVNDFGNEGLTGVISLATSHAAIHIWDNILPAYFQFDLYSCKDFSIETIVEYFNKTFELVSYKFVYLDRNNMDFKVLDTNLCRF